MSTCDFSVEFKGDAEALLAKANRALEKINGKFEGDDRAGQFDLSTPIGAVKGSYLIEGAFIHIIIETKPMFISCKRMEEELGKYLAAQP